MNNDQQNANLPAPFQVPVVPRAVAAAPTPVSAPDAMSLLRALRRRWLLATVLGIFSCVVVGGTAYVMVPSANYKAQAMLQVASYNPKVLVDTSEARSDFRTYQKTQEAMIKSRLVLNAALKTPGVSDLPHVKLQADPVEWLEKEVQVDYANGSEILRIGFSGKDPREVMQLTNAVTRAYLDEIVEVEAKSRRERRDMLKQIWDGYQTRLMERRAQLKEKAEVVGSDDKQALAIIHQSEQTRLARAEDDLARIQAEMRGLVVEAKVLRKQAAISASMARATPEAIDELVDHDQRIMALAERIDTAQQKITQLERHVMNRVDPAIQRQRRELKDAKDAMADLRTRLRPAYERQLASRTSGESNEKGTMLEERIKVLQDLETTLKSDVSRLSARARTITRGSVDMAAINDEIAAADGLAKRVGAEVEVMSVELQAPAKVRLVELAELPRTKDEMKRVKVAGMMGFGALAAAVGCVSFMEWRTRRIASSYEVSHSLGLRVFGTLPAAPVRGRLGSVDPGREMRWQSVLTESVDAARTALLHASRTEPLQMVMIASAVGGEGKTSLSAHLSGSLARAGRRTLLVDCDLRRPSANRLFDLEQGPGMCEILRGEVGVAEAIRPTGVRNLSLLPAGWCDAAAIQALAHVEVQSLFDQLRREYDFVIIDTSPVLPVSDALLIAQHADAVLFSVMRNVSRTPMVQSAYHRLESLGTRMLGAVVTGEIGMTYGGRYEYEYRFGNRPGEVAASTQVGES